MPPAPASFATAWPKSAIAGVMWAVHIDGAADKKKEGKEHMPENALHPVKHLFSFLSNQLSMFAFW